MITGTVTDDGIPVIQLKVAGRDWRATVDTGFNGDLELPEELKGKLNDRPAGRVKSALAGGQIIEEDAYAVEFPFDGKVVDAVATYVSDSQILIGTNLLREYELRIGFVSKSLRLKREQTAG
ncbi:MAG: hypothetical protein WD065_16385 [Planctomycetaceae bacterium]